MKEPHLGGEGLGVGNCCRPTHSIPHTLQTQTVHRFPLYFMQHKDTSNNESPPVVISGVAALVMLQAAARNEASAWK